MSVLMLPPILNMKLQKRFYSPTDYEIEISKRKKLNPLLTISKQHKSKNKCNACQALDLI